VKSPLKISDSNERETSMAETPHYAHLVALLFLGSAFVIFVCVLVAIVAAISKVRRVVRFASAGAALTALGYGTLLLAVALASSNKSLPPGGWKYFCEADCHIAYTVDSAQKTSILGPQAKAISARGQFVVVRLKTWFDEHSIAPFRGNGPLTPDARMVTLVDDRGHHFFPLALPTTILRGESAPLTEPLRPGESYLTTLVFDLPADARDLKLLISDVDPITTLLVDHENSPWHGKIYLSLGLAPSATASAFQ
jgi:hypothetical protein